MGKWENIGFCMAINFVVVIIALFAVSISQYSLSACEGKLGDCGGIPVNIDLCGLALDEGLDCVLTLGPGEDRLKCSPLSVVSQQPVERECEEWKYYDCEEDFGCKLIYVAGHEVCDCGRETYKTIEPPCEQLVCELGDCEFKMQNEMPCKVIEIEIPIRKECLCWSDEPCAGLVE